MTIRPFLMIFLLLPASGAWGAEDEVWLCYEGVLAAMVKENPLITLTRHGSGKSGDLTVIGLEKTMTAFLIEGFKRQWAWPNPRSEGSAYAFVIHPDGDAYYYVLDQADVDSRAQASETYKCEMQ